MSKPKHVHKFIRVNGKFTKIFKCALPDCTFFIHASQQEILIGRYSLCNNCENKFIMDESSLNEDIPKCIDCKFRQSLGLKRAEDNEITITDLDGFLSLKGIE